MGNENVWGRTVVMRVRAMRGPVVLALALIGWFGCGGEKHEPVNTLEEVTPAVPADLSQFAKGTPQVDGQMRWVIETAEAIFVGVVEADLGEERVSDHRSDDIQRVDFYMDFDTHLIQYRVKEVLFGDLDVGKSVQVSHLIGSETLTFDADAKLNTELIHPGAHLILAVVKRKVDWLSRDEIRLPIPANESSITVIRQLIATIRQST
jgi:hypothetical protein